MEGLHNYTYSLSSIDKILANHCYRRFTKFDYIVKPYTELKESLSRHQDYFLSPTNEKEFDDSFYFKVAKDYYSINEYDKACKCFLISAQKQGKLQADAYFALGCIKILNEERPDQEFSIARNLYGDKIAQEDTPSFWLLNQRNLTYKTQGTITFHGLKSRNQSPSFGLKGQRVPLLMLNQRIDQVKSFLNNEFRYILLDYYYEGEVEIEATTVKVIPEDPAHEYDNECIGVITKANINGFDRDELILLLSSLQEQINEE